MTTGTDNAADKTKPSVKCFLYSVNSHLIKRKTQLCYNCILIVKSLVQTCWPNKKNKGVCKFSLCLQRFPPVSSLSSKACQLSELETLNSL